MQGHLTVVQGIQHVPTPDGKRFVHLFSHGSLSVEFYAPRITDPQTPHTRDEIYVVVSGTGKFQCGSEEATFATGDVLFAPAAVKHRFKDFSDDFSTWVFFYGPEGGEKEG